MAAPHVRHQMGSRITPMKAGDHVSSKKLLGERLQRRAQEKGWSIRQLALHIGVSPQSLHAIQRGKTWPAIETLVALAKTLDLSTDYLLGLTDVVSATRQPSWTDFVLTLVDNHNDQLSALVQQLHCTINDLLPVERQPGLAITQKLATFYHIPALALAIIIGCYDASSLTAETAAEHGGVYLQYCREAAGFTRTEVVTRWNTLWDYPLTEQDWAKIENQGTLRAMHRVHMPLVRLNSLPGIWLWALVHATSHSPSTLYADVIGLAALLKNLSGNESLPCSAFIDRDAVQRLQTEARQDTLLGLAQYRTFVQTTTWDF